MGRKNSVFFMGNAGADATEHVTNTTRIVTFNLCDTVKGKDGKPDISTWMKIKCFGYTADDAREIKRGANVAVSGRLHNEEWVKDGVKMKETLIVADQLVVAGPRNKQAPVAAAPTQEWDDQSGVPF